MTPERLAEIEKQAEEGYSLEDDEGRPVGTAVEHLYELLEEVKRWRRLFAICYPALISHNPGHVTYEQWYELRFAAAEHGIPSETISPNPLADPAG